MLDKISRIRKAIAAGVLAGGPLALAALQDQSPGGSDLVRSELIAVAVTAVVALAGVYSIPNEET